MNFSLANRTRSIKPFTRIPRRLDVARARFHANVSTREAQGAGAQERVRAAADALGAANRDAEAWRNRCASSERELAASQRHLNETRRSAARSKRA